MSEFSLEKKMKTLEDIERYFQGSEINLEEGIKKHEEALKLGAEIVAYLEKAENTLEEINLKNKSADPE